MVKDKVCIELHTDNNYVIPTIVTITSMLKNKNKDSEYSIRVLGNNLTDKNIKLLEQLPVQFIPHKSSFEQFEGTHDFVSSTDLFKFDLPDVLNDWDKVLYIDTDMIIQDDLTELFNTDLGDNYVAAVKDMEGMLSGEHHLRLGIANYFNAGLMLLNLKKMREDNIRTALIDYKINKDQGYFMSQDALNHVFKEKVTWLPPTFNYMAPNMPYYTVDKVCQFYNINKCEYKKTSKNSTIIHLTNKKKPWKYREAYGYKLWKKYYKASICRKMPLIFEDKITLKDITQMIFSIKNEYCEGLKYKVIQLLGIKIKFLKNN